MIADRLDHLHLEDVVRLMQQVIIKAMDTAISAPTNQTEARDLGRTGVAAEDSISHAAKLSCSRGQCKTWWPKFHRQGVFPEIRWEYSNKPFCTVMGKDTTCNILSSQLEAAQLLLQETSDNS